MVSQINNPEKRESSYLDSKNFSKDPKGPLLALLKFLSESGITITPSLLLNGETALAIAETLLKLLRQKLAKKSSSEEHHEIQINNDITKAIEKLEHSVELQSDPAGLSGVFEVISTMNSQYKSEKKDTRGEILRLEAITNALIEHDKERKHPSKNGRDSHGTSGHK